jgi:hypothetical protein
MKRVIKVRAYTYLGISIPVNDEKALVPTTCGCNDFDSDISEASFEMKLALIQLDGLPSTFWQGKIQC